MRRHHRNVHAEIKHVCAKCGASFGDRNTWKRHVDAHAPSVLFHCSLCAKKFKRKSQLRRHAANVHKTSARRVEDVPTPDVVEDDTKTKVLCSTCDQCKAVFRKPYDLKIHMRVHTGERPYQVGEKKI